MKKRIFSNLLFQRLLAIFVVCVLFLGNYRMINAQETDFLRAEYLSKKQAGIEIYELIDQDGIVMGYYEPYSETNPVPTIMPRISVDLGSWSIPGNTTSWQVTSCYFSKGATINLSISQSPLGSSYFGYVGLYDNTNDTYAFPSSSLSNSGFSGTIKVAYSGNFSLAIQNISNYKITYSGSYSY